MKKIVYFSLIILSLGKLANGQVTLYGMTRGEGAKIIKFDAANNDLAVVHQFQKNTVPWYNSLIQAKDGKLYGMMKAGGAQGHGVLFSWNPFTSIYQSLYDFDGISGRSPYGSLVQASNGKLYGLTEGGGTKDAGVIFSFDPATAAFTKLYDFDGTSGRSPYGSLVQASNGKLYGLTEGGGTKDMGTVFSFDIATNTYTKLHEFSGTDGRSPYGSLVQASDGALYGMTQFGGTKGYGTIFSIDPASNNKTVRHNFNWSDGAWPNSSLIETNGKLYGMTESGGANFGTMIEFDPAANKLAKVESFIGSNGRSPYGSLIKASNTELYGMTYRGGANDKGVLFSMDPAGGNIVKLKDFTGTNGAHPGASLTEVTLQGNIPLPVKILSYTVQISNRKVVLELVVDEEYGIEKYEVQRSEDGINFTPIAFANAKNENKKTQYVFYDGQPLTTNYYRIKIQERNNISQFTVIKKIEFGKPEFMVQLNVNPILNDISLLLRLPEKEQLTFRLIDIQGRLVENWGNKIIGPGEHHLQLQMNNLQQGIYLLEIRSLRHKRILKLIR